MLQVQKHWVQKHWVQKHWVQKHWVQNLWVDTPLLSPLEETNVEQAGSPSTNIWLFTDPLAKAVYAQRGELSLLEQDIRTFAMFHEQWDADELEFKRRINELIEAEWLAPGLSFANVSPHPTIYKALRPGKIEIRGEKYHFHISDEIIFASWPERLSHPGINGPLRIGRFAISDSVCLCSQAYPQLTGLSSREFEMLHQISYYPKHRQATLG
jgi:hypothetical protein